MGRVPEDKQVEGLHPKRLLRCLVFPEGAMYFP